MERKRVPGYITTEVSHNFGLEVKVQRQPFPKVDMPAAGNPTPEGQTALGATNRAVNYREVIPHGTIGSTEGLDNDLLTLPQYIDTVPSYPTEQNDPRLHGSMAALRAADTQSIPLRTYDTFQPRTLPMPRDEQDDMCLPYKANEHAADTLMKEEDSSTMILPHDVSRKDLYGPNRDGVLRDKP